MPIEAAKLLGKTVKYNHSNGTIGIVVGLRVGMYDGIFVQAPGFGTLPGRTRDWTVMPDDTPISDARARTEAGKPWKVEIWSPDGKDVQAIIVVNRFHWVLGR